MLNSKYLKVCMALLGTLLLIACNQQQASVQDLDGHRIQLSDKHYKWTVINYWASWCAPCYQEIPELNAFYQANKQRGIRILGVSYDQAPADQIKKIAAKLNIQFPVLSTDPAELLGIEEVTGLPTTFILSSNGKIQKRLLGPQTQHSLEAAMGQ